MRAMTPKQKKAADDKRVERLFYARCRGVQIGVLDIGRVFRAGQIAVDAGGDDAAVGDAIAAFVATIRKN